MQLGVGWGLLCMTTRVCVFTVSVWNKSVLYAVQLTRALEEDEFAVEHHLVYRLDQVDSSMASTAHDGVGNIYAQPFSPLVLWRQNHPADLSVLPSIALSIVQYCIACRLSNCQIFAVLCFVYCKSSWKQDVVLVCFLMQGFVSELFVLIYAKLW